jgi:hypothetical protein
MRKGREDRRISKRILKRDTFIYHLAIILQVCFGRKLPIEA